MPSTLTAFEESSKYVGQTKLQMMREPVPDQSQKKSREDDWDQGTNARKVISEVYAFFVLQCTVFGRKSGKVKARRMSQPGMESILTKVIYEIFWT